MSEIERSLRAVVLTSGVTYEDIETIKEAARKIEAQAKEIAELRAALVEAEETLRLVEHPAFPDPLHHAEVKQLGQRIGFGALMATASAGWRESMKESGYPTGSEFVAGPCRGTVVRTLEIIRKALGQAGLSKQSGP